MSVTGLSRAIVEHGLRPSVLRPARYIVAHRHRPLFAVGNMPNALGGNAVARQEVSHRDSTASAERDVVLAGAALIGMSLDGNRVLRILLQPARLLAQRLLCLGRQIAAVGREVDDVADVLREVASESGVAGVPLPARPASRPSLSLSAQAATEAAMTRAAAIRRSLP